MDLLPIIILILSIIITSFNSGFFSLPSFVILVSFYILSFYCFLNPRKIKFIKGDLPVRLVLLFVYSLFIFFSGGIYQTVTIYSMLLIFITYLLFPLILNIVIFGNRDKPNVLFNKFMIILFGAAFIRLFMIAASPAPVIDVFTMLKEAPQVLLKGINPYSTAFSNVYKGVSQNYYTYWPVSFLLELPFVAFLKDPRYLLAFSDIGSAVFIYLIGRKTYISILFALIFLFRPNSDFLIEQSYIEPLVFFLFSMFYYLLNSKKDKSPVFLGVLLGLMTGIKFHYGLLLLPYLFVSEKSKKILAGFVSTLALTVLPFLFWNPQSFIGNTIGYFLKSQDKMPNVPVYMSLNLNTFYHLFTGSDFPFVFSVFLFLTVTVIILFGLKRYKLSNGQILLASNLLLTSFYLLFRFAYINYYYFISGIFILWNL